VEHLEGPVDPAERVPSAGRDDCVRKPWGIPPSRLGLRVNLVYLWFALGVFLLLSPSPISSADSGGYRDPTHRNMQLLWAALRGWSFRPWTIVLPFTLAGPDKGIEIGQTIIFGLSFSFLIWSITTLPYLRASTRFVVAFLLVMLALSPGLISWNLLILSESLSVSYSVFVVASLLHYYASGRALFLALGGVSAGFSILSKPLLAIVFIPLILILVIWSIRTVGWSLKPRHDNAPRRVMANPRFWLAVAVTVFSLLASIWYVSRQDATRFAELAPTQEDSIVHLIATDDPLNGLVRQSLSGTTIPKCVPLAHATPIGALAPLEAELFHTCPQFRSWAIDHFARWYLGFVLQHPSWARDYVSNLVPYALVTQLREPVTSLAIPPISDTLWGAFSVPPYPSQAATSQLQPESFEDPMLAVVFGVNVFAIWLLLKKRHRSSFGEDRTRLVLPLVGLVDLSLITIVGQLLIFPSSALEVARIALEANVLLRVGLIVAVGIVGEYLWTEFRRTRTPEVLPSK